MSKKKKTPIEQEVAPIETPEVETKETPEDISEVETPEEEKTEPAAPVATEEAEPEEEEKSKSEEKREEIQKDEPVDEEEEVNPTFQKVQALCEIENHKLDYLIEKDGKFIAQIIENDEELSCKQFEADSEEEIVKKITKFFI